MPEEKIHSALQQLLELSALEGLASLGCHGRSHDGLLLFLFLVGDLVLWKRKRCGKSPRLNARSAGEGKGGFSEKVGEEPHPMCGETTEVVRAGGRELGARRRRQGVNWFLYQALSVELGGGEIFETGDESKVGEAGRILSSKAVWLEGEYARQDFVSLCKPA
jgi:hypothetical protein